MRGIWMNKLTVDEMVSRIIEIEKNASKKKLFSETGGGFRASTAKINSDAIDSILKLLEEDQDEDQVY